MSDINWSIVYANSGKYYQLTFTKNDWIRCAVIISGALDSTPVNLVISFFRMSSGGYTATKSCEFNHPYITFYTDTQNLFLRFNNNDDSPNKLLIHSITSADNNYIVAQLIDPTLFNLTPILY